MAKREEIIKCKDCKYFYRPVCTRIKCLPIVRSNGYCYLAVKGKYEGDTPVIEKGRGVMKDQTVKKDAGKLELSLVPTEIIEDVAEVMMFGAQKYSRGSWVNCEPQRYIDAMLRHILLYLKEPDGVDKESGLPHLSHVATNVAFLCHFRRDKEVEE